MNDIFECECIADAYVCQDGSGHNTRDLIARENTNDCYILLGFQLPSGIDLSRIDYLELEIYVKDYGGDYDWEGTDYYGNTMFFDALPSFDESTVNWIWHFNNSVYLGQDLLKTPKTRGYYKILNIGREAPDLLAPLLGHVTGDKKLFFSWKGSDTWQKHSSKEGGYPPRLFVVMKPECTEGAHEVLEYCPDGVTEKRWRDCIAGKWVSDSRICPECAEGHEVLEYCPDGVTEKRWRDCIAGKWVYDSRICPECAEGAHEVLDYCPDSVTEKRWRDCINGFWAENSQECPKKDTELKCYDKTTESGKKVFLNAKLEEKVYPYYGIKDGLVKFYVADTYVGSSLTDNEGNAYLDYTSFSFGVFTIKAVFSAAGDYNGSEGTCTLTVKAPPSKKDTKIKCYDKTTDVHKKVTLEVKLEEAATPYSNIKDGLIKFSVSGAYVGYDHTDADGKAYVDYTPTSAGTFTIKAVFEAAGDYNGSEGEGTLTVKKSVVTQKVIVIGSGGFLGLLTFSGLGLDFPVTRRERIKTVQFGRDMDRLSIATLFVNACKVELSINGEKVADAWAKHNQTETKAVLLKGGEGIPTEGKDLEIELKCGHVIGSGLKYAACATIVGIKEE